MAWARSYYLFREEVEKQRARYVEGVDLTIGANLVAAEEQFLAADCPLQRMLGNLPPVPGKEEFLAYYFTPTVERIVAARAAFDAARRL